MIQNEDSLPKISVLMSTYNGQQFIREQIDSILFQEKVHVNLVIRDDGSSDNTKKVIKEYMDSNNNINAFFEENIGAGQSFMNLLFRAPLAEYYAFADQDDVWQKDKLFRAIAFIKERIIQEGKDSAKPLLYASNQTAVDEKLEKGVLTHKSLPKTDFLSVVASNPFAGCTMVMNNAFRNIIVNYNRMPSDEFLNSRYHDSWCTICASIFDGVIYDKESRILYRQHQNNTVGIRRYSRKEVFLIKVKRLFTKDGKGLRRIAARDILQHYSNELSARETELLIIIANTPSFINALKIASAKEVRNAFSESAPILFLKGVTGWL